MIAAKPFKIMRRRSEHSEPPKILGFHRGREALSYAVHKLCKKQKPILLAPAIICRSAVADFVNAGGSVRYYAVDECAQPQLDDLILRIRSNNVDALLLNHIFGICPPDRHRIYNECRELGILVVDDMCHCAAARFGTIKLDEDYDVRIFSFRKFIAIPLAAGLEVNSRFGVIENVGSLTVPIVFKVRWRLEHYVFKFRMHKVVKLVSWFKGLRSGYGNEPQKSKLALPVPKSLPFALSTCLADKELMDRISKIRRQHFRILEKMLAAEGIYPLLTVAKNDAPQVYALRDKDGSISRALKEARIGCFVWPGDELPNEVQEDLTFSSVAQLAKEILCIPIHQDLSETEMIQIANEVKSTIR